MQGNTFYFPWEVALMTFLQERLGTFGELLSEFFTLFGEELVLVVIIAFFYWCWNKDQGKRIMCAVGSGLVLNPMAKNLALRRRPYFDNPTVKCLHPVDASGDIMDIGLQGFSFPSAHAMQSTIVFSMLADIIRKNWMTVLAVCLPLLVGISRFCLGVHYPTDVMVGWLMGIACVLGINTAWSRVKDRRILYLVLALIGMPGLFYCRTADFFSGYGLFLGALSGFVLDEQVVRFEGTRDWVQCLIRLIVGVALYAVMNFVLKQPFSSEWLLAGSLGALWVRLVRYTLIGFVLFGVYPMAFKYFEKLTAKKPGAAA